MSISLEMKILSLSFRNVTQSLSWYLGGLFKISMFSTIGIGSAQLCDFCFLLFCLVTYFLITKTFCSSKFCNLVLCYLYYSTHSARSSDISLVNSVVSYS